MITYSRAPAAMAPVTYPAGVASARSPKRISTASTTANAAPANADMARCSSPPTITWLASSGWFIIAAAPVASWPMAAWPAMAEWVGIGLAIAWWLAIFLWAGMAEVAMCSAGIAAMVVPRNTQAAKQTFRIVRNPIPELAL